MSLRYYYQESAAPDPETNSVWQRTIPLASSFQDEAKEERFFSFSLEHDAQHVAQHEPPEERYRAPPANPAHSLSPQQEDGGRARPMAADPHFLDAWLSLHGVDDCRVDYSSGSPQSFAMLLQKSADHFEGLAR